MAGIIKAGQAELLIESGSSRAFEFGDISRLAEEEIAKAKKQGAAIVAQAEQRAVKIESDAALAGQQRAANEAIAVAEKRVKKALQPLLQAMADGVQQLDQQRLQWQQEWETQLIDLACAIAEKIIRHELSFRPEVSTSWVKEVLEMASSETSAQLLFHPEDHQALGAQAERIRQAVSRGLTLDIQPDDTLSRGECRLVTRQGELDQRIESQLSRVMEELLGVPRASRELTGNPSSTGEQTPVPPPAPVKPIAEVPPMNDLVSQIKEVLPITIRGRIVSTEGHTASAAGFPAPIGAAVAIERRGGDEVQAEVVGFRDQLTLLYPLGDISGVRPNDAVRLLQTKRMLRVGPQLLGRVVNSHGHCIDGGPQVVPPFRMPLTAAPPISVTRPRIDQPFETGIRTIDSMLTCGQGQRMGIFAGSGVGKSMTMGMLARYASADVNVIGLIGERGREVNEFLERDLGSEGRKRSVVVVSTSDEPALMRVQAAFAATAIAEFFRDCGKNVLLVMDSLTRFAMAQREIGLAAGEPPTTRGYPPSVFGLLPKLVERAGRSPKGCITAFYTVLVEGDDDNEPVSDTVRGLIDGHTVLSRKLAGRGHFPAIDVLRSISRLMSDLATDEHRENASLLCQAISAYDDHEDLISIGAYRNGANQLVDAAIAAKPAIDAFLKQSFSESQPAATTLQQLAAIANAIRGRINQQVADQQVAQTEGQNPQPTPPPQTGTAS